MSVYDLATNVTSVQSISNFITGGMSQAVQPWGAGDNQNSPTIGQGFQVTVTGTGSVAATAQPVASNDGVNWFTYGSTIAASGTTTATAGAGGTVPYAFFSAYITVLTGTNAKANVTMSA